jgi:AcrR family transcriptional regulator
MASHAVTDDSAGSASSRNVPLEVRQRASRDEVLDAAADAFTERGYAATSIDDVADRLGCTKGRVYHYFRTKGELFLGVHRKALEMALSAVQPAAEGGGTAAERLYGMAEAHARLMMEEASYMRLSVQHTEMGLALEGRTPNSASLEVLRMRQTYEALFETVIAEGTENGEFRPVNPGLMAKAALGSLNWITVWYRPGRSRTAPIKDTPAEFATFIVAGLAADRPAARSRKKTGK